MYISCEEGAEVPPQRESFGCVCGAKNPGYWGIPVRVSEQFTLSFYAMFDTVDEDGTQVDPTEGFKDF